MKNAETIQKLISNNSREADSGCWEWTGPKCSSGRYGWLSKAGVRGMAHRISYEVFSGTSPGKLFVCHRCDNGLCVNPDHLFLGTQKDNMQDCKQKGRYVGCFTDQGGAKNANARPDYEFINQEAARLRIAGKTYSQIREQLNIKSNGHLRNILKRHGL